MVSVSVRRVFQKNTKQLLKQKEVFTWPDEMWLSASRLKALRSLSKLT